MKKWLRRIGFVTVLLIIFLYIAAIVAGTIVGQQPHAVPNEPAKEQITAPAIYNLVNAERVKGGVPPLSNNPLATRAAESKCTEMVEQDYYDHINPKTGVHGYQFAINLIPNGIYFNENLTEGGATTNADVVRAWLESPPHKATLLEPRYTDTGIAVCHRNSQPVDSYIAVQEFVQLPSAQQQATPTEPRRHLIHCNSYEIYGTVQTNCY